MPFAWPPRRRGGRRAPRRGPMRVMRRVTRRRDSGPTLPRTPRPIERPMRESSSRLASIRRSGSGFEALDDAAEPGAAVLSGGTRGRRRMNRVEKLRARANPDWVASQAREEGPITRAWGSTAKAVDPRIAVAVAVCIAAAVLAAAGYLIGDSTAVSA